MKKGTMNFKEIKERCNVEEENKREHLIIL